MRDAYIDNAKGILIFLVVFGHLLERATDWHWDYPAIKSVLTAIFMFHVPAFVFFAGLTAKAENLPYRILRLFVMYVIFQAAYMIFLHFYDGTGTVNFVKPYWLVWFLMAMCFWYALLPVIRSVRHPMILSVVISVVSGTFFWSNYQWSISRVMVFLPFFVIGHLHGRAIIGFAKGLPKWKIAFAVVIPLLAALMFRNGIENPWFYGAFNYAWLKFDDGKGMLYRALTDATAFASILCFVCLVPSKESVLTAIGRNSLSVYLLHGFFALAAYSTFAMLPAKFGDVPALLIAFSASVAVTALTGLNIVDISIRKLTDIALRPILR